MLDLFDKAITTLLFALDFIVPRFITEDVALRYVGNPVMSSFSEWGDYEISCSLDDVQPGEEFDGIGSVDAFQFLGFGLTYRVGNFRPFVNPHGVGHGA